MIPAASTSARKGGVDEYRCETRTTPLTRNDDDIWFICRYRVRIYNNGGQIVITFDLLRCWTSDPGEGEEEASLTLDCPGTLLRGSPANCVASLEGGAEDASAVVFEWESDHANWTDSSDTGGSTWRGVATDTTDVTVTVISGEEAKDTMSETVTVSVEARNVNTDFSFSQLNAGVDTVSGVGWVRGKWGHHNPGTVVNARFVPGSGPWEGEYMLEAPPTLDNVIELHSDFASYGDV